MASPERFRCLANQAFQSNVRRVQAYRESRGRKEDRLTQSRNGRPVCHRQTQQNFEGIKNARCHRLFKNQTFKRV